MLVQFHKIKEVSVVQIFKIDMDDLLRQNPVPEKPGNELLEER